MKQMSTGQDSTIKNWLALVNPMFGEDSAQAKFLLEKAEESPDGVDAEIIADEGQLLSVLLNM